MLACGEPSFSELNGMIACLANLDCIINPLRKSADQKRCCVVMPTTVDLNYEVLGRRGSVAVHPSARMQFAIRQTEVKVHRRSKY